MDNSVGSRWNNSDSGAGPVLAWNNLGQTRLAYSLVRKVDTTRLLRLETVF